jgi:hypothetical protein
MGATEKSLPRATGGGVLLVMVEVYRVWRIFSIGKGVKKRAD